MTFHSPLFLWGLTILIIPILIHFFDFRKVKTIWFSNINFLQALEEQNIPRKRIKEKLLLLFRLLAIAFIIFSFSNPFIIKQDSFSTNESRLLVLDNSYSLGSNCPTSDCSEEIKSMALRLSQNELTSGKIWTTGLHKPRSFFGETELAYYLSEWKIQKGTFLLPEGLKENQVVLSDFQLPLIENIKSLLKDSIKFTLIPVNREGINNVRVDSVQLTRLDRVVGRKTKNIEVSLSNQGAKGVDGMLIRLFDGDRQLGSTTVTLEDNENKGIEFEIESPTISTFKVVLEDYETPFDDEFFFILPELSPISIAIISKDSRNLEAVFGNEELFSLDVFQESTLDFEKIFSADLLILDSFGSLPDWFDWKRISGSVVIIPATDIDLTNYSRTLGMRVQNSSDPIAFDLSSSSIQHPFFNGIFNDINVDVELPKASNKYKIKGGDPLLSGNQNFLTYFENQGLYWFACPLNESFTNIANHSIFLPLMYRIAESTRSYNEPISYELTNAPIELNVQAISEAVPILVNETGRFIPELNYRGSKLIFTLPPDLNEPGIYYLMSGNDTLRTIALNIPKSESIMDFMGYEDLKKHFENESNVRVLDATSLDKLEASMEELGSGRSLWKYGLILALMFLLAETAIHRWVK